MRAIIILCLLLCAMPLLAGPTTLVTIPSTDIEAHGFWHLDADSTVFFGGANAPASFVDVGLLYGLSNRVEVGFDLISGADDPLWVNAKVQLIPPAHSPVALAAGIFNAATAKATNQSVLYVVGSGKPLRNVRLTFGAYQGNATGLVAVNNSRSGVLAGLELGQGKWWYAVDYVGGTNALSSVNYGVSYLFAPNTVILLGYNVFTTGPNALSVQFDIDFK